MKQKVINATYRKESKTFPDWLKYEVTLLNEDGTTETIPAYGKDLQDALSRVVHDKKVVEVEQKTKRIPDVVWVVLWFGYMLGLVELTYIISPYNSFRGIFFLGGVAVVTTGVLRAKSWFRMRNQDRHDNN